MARALTTSEANKVLMEAGFGEWSYIEDNELTIPFGPTDLSYEIKTNSFSGEPYREYTGVRYKLHIAEYSHGESYLKIIKFVGCSGHAVVNYAKLKASEKKHFMEVILNTKTYKLEY